MNRYRDWEEPYESSRSTRRQWLAMAPLAAGATAIALSNRGQARTLPEMTAHDTPLLVGSQVGFRPESKKRILVRSASLQKHAKLLVSGSEGTQRGFSVKMDGRSEFDVSANPVFVDDLRGEGAYHASLGLGEAFSFPVGRDVWLRTLPTLAGYAHHQRCGQSDRSSHATCHGDDARRRDTGKHVDTTGGWHDAGDLRKWVDATIMNLFGLVALARNLNRFPAAGPLSLQALLDEARYGNIFFLKMQDTDGLVWADVGGGIHGDNSDNHWTDGKVGSADDRWINVEKRPAIQAMFITGQAMMAQLFAKSDPTYAATCLNAATRCWQASRQKGGSVTDISWWTMAAVEMSAASPQPEYRQETIRLADLLTSVQVKKPAGGAGGIAGFFPMWTGNQQPLRDAVHSALPAIALVNAVRSLGSSSETKKWSSALRIYLDDYAQPMTSRSAYGILPYGLYLDTHMDEKYRPLSGRYSYRFFMPTKARGGYSGLNSHLLSHALLFAESERLFGEAKYREMAYTHLEWVVGANPFGASLITGWVSISHRRFPGLWD